MKRLLSISILLPAAAGVMTLVLVSIFAIDAFRAVERRETSARVPLIIDVSYDLFDTVQNLRAERGSVNRSLIEQMPAAPGVHDRLVALREQSNKSHQSALSKLAQLGTIDTKPGIVEIENARAAFAKLRIDVDHALQLPLEKRATNLLERWIDANARFIDALDALSDNLESELSQGDPFVGEMIGIKKIVWPLRADSGNERLLLRQGMARGGILSATQRRDFDLLAGRIEGVWRLVEQEGDRHSIAPKLKQAIDTADKTYFAEFRDLRNQVIGDLAAGRPVSINVTRWDAAADAGRTAVYDTVSRS